MTAIGAVMYREGKIRATNVTFIFWDLFYPLGYLLVFGVGMSHAVGAVMPGGLDYNGFFLGGVLGMASFGIAANTAWSFFMDRDNGIFYEMLTYPLSRSQYLIGKVVFNVLIAAAQATVTVVVAGTLVGVNVRLDLLRALGRPVELRSQAWARWLFFIPYSAPLPRRVPRRSPRLPASAWTAKPRREKMKA